MSRLSIWHLMISLLSSVGLLASCSSSTSNDKGSGDSADSTVKTATVQYSEAEVEKFIELYSAGMLSEEDYSLMIKMVDEAFTHLLISRDSLIDSAPDEKTLSQEWEELDEQWSKEFPQAARLAAILAETPPEHIGDENIKAFNALDEKMLSKISELEDKRSEKFKNN